MAFFGKMCYCKYCHVYLYPLKLALASLTGGDRSIGIVRWRTKKPWSTVVRLTKITGSSSDG
jgi:hypothetical protein